MGAIFGSTKRYDESVLGKKLAQMSFRGPDYSLVREYPVQGEEGLYLGYNGSSQGGVAEDGTRGRLGSNAEMRMHCIVAGGGAESALRQPYESDSGRTVIVFDGVLTNSHQLASRYFASESDGKQYVWSDAGIVSALYEKNGFSPEKLLTLLNGSFAFVIYDRMNQTLLGARDRLGIKPFYYHCGDDGFEFASQLFPLCIGNRYNVNPTARQFYFALQYIPDPISIVREVSKLRAGEYLSYNLVSKSFSVSKYWDIHNNSSCFVPPRSYDEAVEVCADLLSDSVRCSLPVGGAVGTFLSGGIDSSLVTAYAHESDSSVEAFSVGFEESQFDESLYSRQVAERLGVKYNHIVCTKEEALKTVAHLQRWYDEPMGDASAIPTSLLAQKAGERVTVALGGDGGDEVFWGYPRYLRYASREWLYHIPLSVRKVAAAMAECAGKKRLALSLKLNDVRELYVNRRVYCPAEKFDAVSLQRSAPDCHFLYDEKDVRKAFNDYDIKTLLTCAYNVKTDRASARGGIDLRTPLLDYRLVEYSRLLPVEYLYSPSVGQKRILRTLLDRVLPHELFDRKKRGFGVPLGIWFRNEMKEYVLDNLAPDTADLLPEYDAAFLLSARDAHISGRADYTTYLWLWLNYIAWHGLFVDLN